MGRGLITQQVAVQVGDHPAVQAGELDRIDKPCRYTHERNICHEDKRVPPGPLGLEDGFEDHKLAITNVQGLDRKNNDAAGGDDQYDQ